MRFNSLALAATALTFAAPLTFAQQTTIPVTVRYQQPIQNQQYPELLYWFVTPETLDPAQYTRDIQHIAHDTVFDFPFLTARGGVNFSDSPEAHTAISHLVRLAHQNGLRIGATIHIQDIDGLRKFPLDDAQTVIANGESTLDSTGTATITSTIKLRSTRAEKTELLRVFVFRKTAPGAYDATTLKDVTALATSTSPQAGSLAVTLHLGPTFAGYTAFTMSTTWFRALDLFSPAYTRWVNEAIDQYRDVPLDGTALDEFGYVRVPMTPTEPYRGQFSGKAFAAQFEKLTHLDLTQTLFETRYAPSGHPEVTIRAIDEYWDFLRKGPLQIEQQFFDHSRAVFGPQTFAGIHNTFHNHLTNDEPWATGIDWWTIPRQYGMSDEDLSLPLRMGLLVSHPGNIMYDQFYGFDIHRFATKALNDARFNARLHYHGYNDTGRWGTDLSQQPFLSTQMPVERKIRLLNQFNPAPPQLPLLVVFGMPALLNWYPDHDARNIFDINGSLHIEEKVQAIWDAGFRCAVVPSELIDNGALHLDAHNHPTLNGHTFRAIVYLYPQYAKHSTLAFFDQYTKAGGALMLEGTATRDFDGQPIDALFNRIASHARSTTFSTAAIPKLGIQPSALKETGGELEDGSVILTDLPSLENNQPQPFSIDLNHHRYTGTYIGVLAIKATPTGTIDKLACGHCGTLSRDGHAILSLATPADIVLHRTPSSAYEAVIEGATDSNKITLRR
ncbi:MAG: hypothetical protein V4555_00940 [Acidobacteriota bacterium]